LVGDNVAKEYIRSSIRKTVISCPSFAA
jgi:hypothetical protein